MSYANNNLYAPKNPAIGARTPVKYASNQNNPTNQMNYYSQGQQNTPSVRARPNSQRVIIGKSVEKKQRIFAKGSQRNHRFSSKGREDIVIKGEIFRGTQHMMSKKENEENILQQRMKMINENNGLKNHNQTRVRSPQKKKVTKNKGVKATVGQKYGYFFLLKI